MSRETRILILEDTATDAELVERELRKAKVLFSSKRVDTKEAFLREIEEFAPDIILSDFSLPQFNGLEALRLLRERETGTPFILVTGSLTEEVAVECMKEGATDYILKTSLKRLPSAVLNALEKIEAERAKEEAIKSLRASEEQLRQSQKLEAVGQLAGGVAHDFNNLLTVITGYCGLILRRLNPDDSMHSQVEEIKKAAERAASLTRQLLAFSRKQVLQPKVLDLNSLVTETSKMLRRLVGENIELVSALDPALGQVKADDGQIEQVIMNLVVNARDAMPKGGKLTVETANVFLDQSYTRQHIAVQPGAYVMLAVSDTGCGMDAETQKHIFEPFYTTKEKGKGTGLGLSTVYGIVKQSGGHLWVYSEVGRGTTFKVYLPRVDESVDARSLGEAHTESPHGWETVLLVEDEDVVRGLLRDVLEMEGYTVLEATGGSEAIRICKQHEGPIHLMITDVVMPQMGGREIAERVKPLRPEMRVLFMSGYTDDAIVHHGVLDAEVAFLEKPFTPDAVARKVRTVLDAPQKSSELVAEYT